MGPAAPGAVKKSGGGGDRPKPVPADWAGIFRFLRDKRGLSREHVLDLTAAQLVAELGEAKATAKPISRREIDAKAAAKRDAMFARICDDAKLTPAQLARLPHVDLVGRVRRFCGGKPIDESLVPAWAEAFAQRAATTANPPCP